ncbi:fimbrial protein [uncultured Cedecea sp.]|uniref:fimbrial protein n=1 Tax=uncultured Cedecea sp. TaxID=988762 RepID=UPI002628FE95|nr:fimbrial protein [uncultured Cedecea sp.]
MLASDIKQAGETGIQAKDITVTYANCSGLGISPKLSVTGGAFTAGIPLFSDTDAATDSDARGYGVRLVHKGNMDTPLDNKDVVPVGQPDMQLGDLNGTESGFSASLSCGSNCGGTTLRNGDLTARVTFTFLYE